MLNYLNNNAKVLIIFGIKKTYSYYLWFYNDFGFEKLFYSRSAILNYQQFFKKKIIIIDKLSTNRRL